MMLATVSFVEIYIYRFGRRNYLVRQSCKIRIPKMVSEGPIPDMYNTLPYCYKIICMSVRSTIGNTTIIDILN